MAFLFHITAPIFSALTCYMNIVETFLINYKMNKITMILNKVSTLVTTLLHVIEALISIP